ncbi:recombinase family protein [Ruminiclostridium herbifermentans]|uniref:Recombinase family protein n=1 Tax=Ruminiclostridium herbifermentans TaxID=2488810 RepID=A0A4U7JI26_9FIRM|nr:recombinase family protein [Ruminiclostridium herbifermentans]QNU65770.1 recombinase family protein [Ruminiclostridium herbifermentans]
MKCVAYCRVSSDNPEQMTSLENQIRHYTELFNKKGFEGADCGMYYCKDGKKEYTRYIKSIFADEGISGTKLKNRGAFKYMLECAYRKEFDAILVKNVQRWARNVEDGAGIIKKLKVMGIKVIFEDGWLDSSNPANEATINILFVMAQEESRAKSTAVQFGIRKAQEAGKFTSACPYGYKSKNGFLVPIPEQIEVVKKIFDLYLEGWGSTRIVKYLNKENIPTQKGRKWSTPQIYYILANQIYVGRQITHTVVNTDINIDRFEHKGKIYRSRKPIDEGSWIITEREDLRAVSDEIFDKVQKQTIIRKEMFSNSNRPSNAHLFSNLLFCRNCGMAMRRKKLWGWKRKDGTRNTGIEWVCIQHDKYHNDICRYRNSWHEEVLIKRVKEEIENLRLNKENLDKMFSQYMQSYFSAEELTEKIKELQHQLDDIKAQMSANLRLFSKDIIGEEQYKQQNDELQSSKKAISKELTKLKNIDEEKKQALLKYNNYIDFLNNVDIDNLDNAQLKKIINRIEAYTIFDDDGKEHRYIYIVWNMLDKSYDDILYKSAKN